MKRVHFVWHLVTGAEGAVGLYERLPEKLRSRLEGFAFAYLLAPVLTVAYVVYAVFDSMPLYGKVFSSLGILIGLLLVINLALAGWQRLKANTKTTTTEGAKPGFIFDIQKVDSILGGMMGSLTFSGTWPDGRGNNIDSPEGRRGPKALEKGQIMGLRLSAVINAIPPRRIETVTLVHEDVVVHSDWDAKEWFDSHMTWLKFTIPESIPSGTRTVRLGMSGEGMRVESKEFELIVPPRL